MSREINVQFEVRNMLIMKDTLKKLGFDYREIGDHQLNIRRNYHPISIDSKTGMITYDEMDNKIVNQIRQGYTTAFYKDKAIREGCQVSQETNSQGEIVLHITRS